MIQILTLILSLVFCSFAHAAGPKPGDFFEERRTYYYTTNKSDVLDIRITVTRYDSATQTVYWQQQVRTNGGAPEMLDDSSPLTEFIDLRMAGANHYGNCDRYGGTIEIVTVPAGTFSTCRIVRREDGHVSTTWWAPEVPNGYVRIDYDSETLDAQFVLTSYEG